MWSSSEILFKFVRKSRGNTRVLETSAGEIGQDCAECHADDFHHGQLGLRVGLVLGTGRVPGIQFLSLGPFVRVEGASIGTMARIKGIAVIPVVRRLQGTAGSREMLSEAAREIFDGPVAVSAWYSETAWMEMLELAVNGAAEHAAPDVLWTFIGRLAARRDADELDGWEITGLQEVEGIMREHSGLYRHWLVDGDPEATLKRLGPMWRMYHDTGTRKVRVTDSHRVVISLADYQGASPNHCRIESGYFAEVIALAGGLEPSIEHPLCRHLGASQCDWAVTWRSPSTEPVSQAPEKLSVEFTRKCSECGWINERSSTVCSSCRAKT